MKNQHLFTIAAIVGLASASAWVNVTLYKELVEFKQEVQQSEGDLWMAVSHNAEMLVPIESVSIDDIVEQYISEDNSASEEAKESEGNSTSEEAKESEGNSTSEEAKESEDNSTSEEAKESEDNSTLVTPAEIGQLALNKKGGDNGPF